MLILVRRKVGNVTLAQLADRSKRPVNIERPVAVGRYDYDVDASYATPLIKRLDRIREVLDNVR